MHADVGSDHRVAGTVCGRENDPAAAPVGRDIHRFRQSPGDRQLNDTPACGSTDTRGHVSPSRPRPTYGDA